MSLTKPAFDASLPIAELLKRDPSYMAQIEAIGAAPTLWLSIRMTAALLGRSVRQVRRYEAEGRMPPRKRLGREWRYARADIEKMKETLPG
jgi:predicted DNA-binding transcriptional regulator AlpA